MQKELRAAKPAAPDELRERVRAIAATTPQRAPFLARFEWRRLVLVAPATLVVAVAAAGVIGLTRGDGTDLNERSAAGQSGPRRPRSTSLNRAALRRTRRRAFGAPETACPARQHRRSAELRPAAALRGRAAAAGQRRRGALERDEARAADRDGTRRPRRLALLRRPGRGNRRGPDHAARPDEPDPERRRAALGARHDPPPALRDRGSPAAGRQPAGADRGDAAPDRPPPHPAQEHEPRRRGAGDPAVASDRGAPDARRPPAEPEGHPRRGTAGDGLPDADHRANPGCGDRRRRRAERGRRHPPLGGHGAPLRACRRRPVPHRRLPGLVRAAPPAPASHNAPARSRD